MDAQNNLTKFNAAALKAVQDHEPALQVQTESTRHGIEVTRDTTRVWVHFILLTEGSLDKAVDVIRYEVEVYLRTGEAHWRLKLLGDYVVGNTGVSVRYSTSRVEAPTDLAVRVAEDFKPTMVKLMERLAFEEKLRNV